MFMNYYEILGINKNASNEDIKSAYKTLAKQYHPDVYDGDKDFAQDKIAEINVAYNTLIDEQQRKEYDIKNNLIEIQPKPVVDEDFVEGFYNSRLFTGIKETLKERKEIKAQRQAVCYNAPSSCMEW